ASNPATPVGTRSIGVVDALASVMARHLPCYLLASLILPALTRRSSPTLLPRGGLVPRTSGRGRARGLGPRRGQAARARANVRCLDPREPSFRVHGARRQQGPRPLGRRARGPAPPRQVGQRGSTPFKSTTASGQKPSRGQRSFSPSVAPTAPALQCARFATAAGDLRQRPRLAAASCERPLPA